MKKNPILVIVFVIFVFASLFFFVKGLSQIQVFSDSENVHVTRNNIVMLELDGVIYDAKKFIKKLSNYRKKDAVKAIVISVDSPGGVVGPSQELYEEIKRTRTEFKKPVVVVSTGLMASGAYYAAVAADKIVVAPGTMMGSIGVIMEFANLEKLYDWAKVTRYSITSGKFKDSGAEYRSMRDDEKQLFQDLIDNVYAQFKKAVADGRQLKEDVVTQYADGRVFTGQQGVELGFADKVGTTQDAVSLAAEMAGLDKDYELIEPAKPRANLMDLIRGDEEEPESMVQTISQKVLKTQLLNKPLFIMPGMFN